ncbi:hypothetical protein AgCh_022329 [Apium graveolens]
MEVKFYVTDNINSNLINSHVSSSTSSIIIDSDNFEFEFEMVALEAPNNDHHDTRYTSLKDISPPPSESLISRKESWREVPLKDPLVQQAAWAWAYLPFSQVDHQKNSFMGKLKDGFVGCFKNVILVVTCKLLPDDENYDTDVDQETCKNVD